MLLETQTDFAVVDPEEDLARYETIVLTGQACLSEADAARLNDYAAGGGGLLVLGESGLAAIGSGQNQPTESIHGTT